MPRVLPPLSLCAALILAVGVAAAPSRAALTTIRVASGLNRPIFVTAPEGDDRLFIVEQRGVIKILEDGVVKPQPFLDIDNLVTGPASSSDERGLLGLAFHPDYQVNGKFYLDYINNNGDTQIVERYVSGDPDLAIPDSMRSILVMAQPFSNHNGGTLAFGPNDGYLYIGMGDGGSGGDPADRAQDLSELLGKMLRIDVDVPSGYAVPGDNPYVGVSGARDEIWAAGLRNPYRWSFDRLTGDLYIADVGQSCFEEVDFQPASSGGGENYGWDIVEAFQCFNEANFGECDNAPCGPDSLVEPIVAYDHPSGGCAVTGGYVYRGGNIPSLQGTYFYADYCTAIIWSIRYDGMSVTDSLVRTAELAPGGGLSIGSIAGFGEDGHGELYIVDRGTTTTGEVYRIVDAALIDVPATPAAGGALRLASAVPNPFTSSTRFEVVLARRGRLRVEVVDAAGRRVRQLYAGEAAPGVTRLSWDGRDQGGREMASGVYFLRASSEGERASRRIQLIR